MDKHEINAKIAELLGFKKHGITVNGIPNREFAWSYPKEYESQRAESPEYYIPDFVSIIDNAIQAQKILGGSGIMPRDYKA